MSGEPPLAQQPPDAGLVDAKALGCLPTLSSMTTHPFVNYPGNGLIHVTLSHAHNVQQLSRLRDDFRNRPV